MMGLSPPHPKNPLTFCRWLLLSSCNTDLISKFFSVKIELYVKYCYSHKRKPQRYKRYSGCHLRAYSHETFSHTILRLKDIFGPWISISQDKLLKNQGMFFFRAYLGWSIETCVSFYCIPFYRNITILCAKTSRVNKALTWLFCLEINFWRMFLM